MSESELNLNHSLFKNMPVLTETVRMAGISFMMKDSMFLHKLNRFILGLPEPLTEKQDDMVWDTKFQKRIGDFLIVIFDRIDALDKTEIFAKIFSAFVSQKISFSQFRKLASGMTIAFMEDLEELTDSPCKGTSEREARESLLRAGFMEKDSDVSSPDLYKITKLGELFVRIIKDNS